MKSFGEQANFRENLNWARKTKKATAQNQAHEKVEFLDRGRPWLLFMKNVGNYVQRFEKSFPGVSESFYKKIAEKRAKDEDVLIIDLAGAAGGESLGVKTISVTLTKEANDEKTGRTVMLEPQKGQVLLEGDLLTAKTQRDLLQQVRTTHIPVSFIFCSPLGGAGVYSMNPYAFRKFKRLLDSMYLVLDSGGEMFFDLSFLPKESIPDIRVMLKDTNAVVSVKDQFFHVIKPDLES